MGEIQDGMNVGDGENQNEQDIVDDDVVDGIMRSLESGQEEIKPESISYFQSVPDEELDIPGLEVPEKED